MKKFITTVAVCLITCLFITGLIPANQALAAEETGAEDFASVIAVKPQEVTFLSNKYFRIVSSEGNNSGTAMQKWKWVLDNTGSINDGDIILIEEELDFSNYIPSTLVSLKNINNSAIRFGIAGGRVILDPVSNTVKSIEKSIATIKGFNLDINADNYGFINKLDNTAKLGQSSVTRLKFVDCNYTNSNSTEYAGGVVGVLINGTISAVSFENSTIDAKYVSRAVGGIVGKVINGKILNCDFSGNESKAQNIGYAISTKSNVGGIVGEIIVGDLINNVPQYNEVNLTNVFFIGGLSGMGYVGGLIGNIGYRPHDYDKTQKTIANINVTTSYADVTKIDTSDKAFGILGNIVTEYDDISGPPIAPDPNNPNPNALPIEGIVFSNIISPSTTVGSYTATGEPVAIALDTFPKNFAKYENNQKVCILIPSNEFNIPKHYIDAGFDASAWIMPSNGTHLDLAYKHDSLRMPIKIVGGGSTNIAENIGNNLIKFIKGQPIIMSLIEADGRFVNKIYVTDGTKQVILYTAGDIDVNGQKKGTGYVYDFYKSELIIGENKQGQNGDIILIDKYEVSDGTNTLVLCEKTQDGYKITPNINVVFDYNDDNGNPTMNSYNVNYGIYNTITREDLSDDEINNGGNNLIYYLDSQKKPQPYTSGVAIKDIKHSDVLTVYIRHSVFNDYELFTVEINSRAGSERLVNEDDKGYSHKASAVDINGVQFDKYEIRLNHLDNKLFNNENITLKFHLEGRKASIDVRDQHTIELIKNGDINATFFGNVEVQANDVRFKEKVTVDSKNVVEYVAGKYYTMLNGMKIEVSKENETSYYRNVFTTTVKTIVNNVVVNTEEVDVNKAITGIYYRLGKLNNPHKGMPIYMHFSLTPQAIASGKLFYLYKSADKQMYIKINGKEVAVKPYQYDNKDASTLGFITQNVYVCDGDTKVELNIATKRKISIKQDALVNPPSFKIHRVPVIAEGMYVAGYTHIECELTKNNNVLNVEFKPDTNNLFESIYAGANVSADEVKNLFTYDQSSEIITFYSINELEPFTASGQEVNNNPKFELIPTENYLSYNSCRINGTNRTDLMIDYVNGSEKAKEIDLTKIEKNVVNIELGLEVKQFKYFVNIWIMSDDPSLNKVKELDSIGTKVGYGKNITINQLNYISSIIDKYEFLGWQYYDGSTEQNDLPLEIMLKEDSLKISQIGSDKQIRLIVTPKYSVKVNSNNNSAGRIYRVDSIGTEFEDYQNKYSFLKKEFIKEGTSPVEYNKLIYKIITEPKYILSLDQASIDLGFVLTEINKGEYKLELDIAKLPAINEAKDMVVNLVFTERTIKVTAKVENATDKDNRITISDSNGEVKPNDSGIFDFNILFGSNIVLDVDIAKNYLEKTKVFINGVDVTNDVPYTSQGTRYNRHYKIEKVKEYDGLNILVVYEKSEIQTDYAIKDRKINIGSVDESGKFVINKELTDKLSNAVGRIEIEYGSTGVESPLHIPGTTKVMLKHVINDKYYVHSWSVQKYDKQGNPIGEPIISTDPMFIINSINCDYVVSVNIIEKEFEINYILPENISILVGVTEEGKAPNKDVVCTGNGSFKVKYNTSVVFKFVSDKSTNVGFAVDYWDDGSYPFIESANFDLGQIRENKTVKLFVKPVTSPDVADKNTIHIKYDIYKGKPDTRTGNINALLVYGGNQVQLTATANKGNKFIRWYKNGVEFSTDPTIVVSNAVPVGNTKPDRYEAEFGVCKYTVNIVNGGDIISIVSPQDYEHGKTYRVELSTKPGYEIDKVIINGEKEISLSSKKYFEIYNIDGDQSIQVVYRKVGKTAEDEANKKIAIILSVIFIIALIVVRQIYKKSGISKKKHYKIHID